MSNPPNINSFGNPPIPTGQSLPGGPQFGQIQSSQVNKPPMSAPQQQNQSQSPFAPNQNMNSSPAFNMSGNLSSIPAGMLPPGQLPPTYIPLTSASHQVPTSVQKPISFQPLNRVPPVSSPYMMNGPNSANSSQPSPVPSGNKPLVFNQSNNSSGAATPVANQMYNGQLSQQHNVSSSNATAIPNGPLNMPAVSQQGSLMSMNGVNRPSLPLNTSQASYPVVPPTSVMGRSIQNQMGTSQFPPLAPVSQPPKPNQFRTPPVNNGPPKTNPQTIGPPSMNQMPPMSQMNYSQPPMTIQPNTSLNQPPFLANPVLTPLQQSGPIGPPPTAQAMFQPNCGPPTGPQVQPTYNNIQAATPNNVQGRYAGITQQMSNLSVTKQGYDQMWGHQMVDLMQSKHILPEFPEDPPEIRHVPQFAESSNCSPEIFRCTVNRIPETNSLLQKSRLPLGILIHPFKDLNHLPVIQCSNIVRCRACRTYINPFVYFVDSKRWKCNLCFRVNDYIINEDELRRVTECDEDDSGNDDSDENDDVEGSDRFCEQIHLLTDDQSYGDNNHTTVPEEFQYDPVSRSYGDPSRRPEIRSATIEYIAPAEYMLRPPQAALYLYLLDVSQMARDSGYLQVFCSTLLDNLDKIPGDGRTQIGFLCFDSHVHFYLMNEALTRPKEVTVLDIDDIFLPSPESLLVNVNERRDLIKELLTILPTRYASPGVPNSALGAALQAAYKLMAPTGGRITVFQCCLPNIGPGALQSREDPNARSSSDVLHLNPSTDFYKRMALQCSAAQVAVDLFLLNAQYSDIATLSGMSKFSSGSIHHIPLFKASKPHLRTQLTRILTRYLTRKIGFEAVMRVRCTRGVSIHTFHGNFFVRSTDLLSLPVVSPDSAFGLQLSIDESLADLQQICFQAALLYTSSKGERRIRVHTLSLPLASNLPEVLHSADQECIIGLLVKMGVDRCVSASMSEAKEALMNVAIDVISASRLANNQTDSQSLLVPASLKLLPMYLLAALKRKAFRTGTSTRLDDRVFDMCEMKTLPLELILKAILPELYPLHLIQQYTNQDNLVELPRLPLSANKIDANGVYLLDDGQCMAIYVGQMADNQFISQLFGVTNAQSLGDEIRAIPHLDNPLNILVNNFIAKLNDDRPYESEIVVYKSTSPSRIYFTERLIEDRFESALSYYEFLQHVRSQVK